MSDAYLDLAEEVLLHVRQPLTPAEMMAYAFSAGAVPEHLFGNTQHKTLHARLSEELSLHPEASRFYRTAPGVFFLKSLRFDPDAPESAQIVHKAPPRRKELRREPVLVVQKDKLLAGLDSADFIPLAQIYDCLDQGNCNYIDWLDALNTRDLMPVQCFVLVHDEPRVLSYRSGRFRPDADPLRGRRTIGFASLVFASDQDLFDSLCGIISSAINELSVSLGLPRRLAEEARYNNLMHPHFGSISEHHNARTEFLHVVLSYRCPRDFSPVKNALSLNQLGWLQTDLLTNNIDDFDATSRKIIERGLIRSLLFQADS